MMATALVTQTMVSNLRDFPGWKPLSSAGYASGFSAFMAAIVVSITVQIAFSQERKSKAPTVDEAGLGLAEASPTPIDSGRSRTDGLVVAPISLTLLLLATYLYVVLAGIGLPDTCNVQGPPSSNCVALASGLAVMSAHIFSIAGTVFAAGALSLLFALTFVVRDNNGSDEAQRWTNSVFVAAIVIVGVFLIYGYETSFRTLRTVGGVRSAPSGGALYWIAHVAALVLPGTVLFITRVRALNVEHRDLPRPWFFQTPPEVWKVALAAVVLFLVPAIVCMALLSYGPGGSWRGDSIWISTLLSSTWYSIIAGSMLRSLPFLPPRGLASTPSCLKSAEV
jgi:hypothetical protein